MSASSETLDNARNRAEAAILKLRENPETAQAAEVLAERLEE